MKTKILIALVILLTESGCATVANSHMGDPAFVTMEECRIALRLGTIDVNRMARCETDRLPETIF